MDSQAKNLSTDLATSSKSSLELTVKQNNKTAMDFEGSATIAVNNKDARLFTEEIWNFINCVPEPEKVKVEKSADGHLRGHAYTQKGIEFWVDVWRTGDVETLKDHPIKRSDDSSYNMTIKADVKATGKGDEGSSLGARAAALFISGAAVQVEMTTSLKENNQQQGKTSVDWSVTITPKDWKAKVGSKMSELIYTLEHVKERAEIFFTRLQEQIQKKEGKSSEVKEK